MSSFQAASTATQSRRADLAQPSARQLFFATFPSIMLPMFLAALDQTIVATALPSIAGTVGDVQRVSWIVVSYLVATTIAAPVYGRLGDVFGRKRLMFVALAIFVVASVLCALSPSIIALTGARILQGLGGGGLMTLSQALVGEAVPPRERGRYQGYLATVFMASSTFGPVAGGWLTQHFGWQSVFMVNIPLGLAAILLALRLPRRGPAGGRFRFDFAGTAFFAAFVGSVLLALEQTQHFDLAAVPLVALLLGIAAISLLLLLRQERRSSQPLLPVKLLGQAAIWRTDLMGFCIGATLVSMVTFVPIYMEVVRDLSPGDTGLLMLPLTACIAVGSLCTGQLISRTGRTAIFPSLGLAIPVAALLFMALAIQHVPIGRLPYLFAVYSFFLGTGMPVVQTTVQQVAGPKLLGSAAASVQFSRSIGAAFGTAVVGAVLFAVLAAADPGTAQLFATMVERGPGVLATLDAARRAVVQQEIADAFRAAFLTIAGFAVCALGCAWWIPVRRI